MRPVPRIEKNCPACGKLFPSLPCQKRRYCSNRCARLGNWRDPEYAAAMVEAHKGKPVHGRPHTRESILKMRAAKFQGRHRTISSTGYAYLYDPDHPRAGNSGRVAEHIVVMEAHIGRPILPTEVVHHINRVRDDNRLENLQLLTTTEHYKLHAAERKLAAGAA